MNPIENQNSFLTLGNTSPIQMGFGVPNRIWATANYLIPLRDHIVNKEKEGALNPVGDEVAAHHV